MNRHVMGDLLRRALSPPSNASTTELIGRAILWIALFLLSWSVVLAPIERSQMAPSFVHLIVSRVNLVFHEAGHVIFSPLGQLKYSSRYVCYQPRIPISADVSRHSTA